MRKTIFPDHFDPITLGHEDLQKRNFLLRNLIAIGVNAEKNTCFT